MSTTLTLDFRQFRKDDYQEYAAWFVDPELNNRLGSLDQEWLEALLSQKETEGMTWAVFRDAELVAVIETVFHPQDRQPAAIAGIATKPSLRGQGIGTAVLKEILSRHQSQGIYDHIAYVASANKGARRWIERIGFRPTAIEPNEHGYLEFWYSTR